MSKRKKFTISDDISRGITDVINAVNNNSGIFRYEVVALSRIEKDPENPRELMITADDIRNGINASDKNLADKNTELAELSSLAHSIKNQGIINPIVVYKHDVNYRLVAGERRYLAAIIAGKDDIHARILNRKPNKVDLSILQWAENNERTDLNLKERLNNLKTIIEAYKEHNSIDKVTGDELSNLTGLAKTQAYGYLSVLVEKGELMEQINRGVINSLDKAMFIANIKNSNLKNKILSLVSSNMSFKELKTIVAAEKNKMKANKDSTKKGRQSQYVKLGRTKNIKAVKKIVDVILEHPDYNKHARIFNKINWNDYHSVSIKFQEFLALLSGV